MSTSVSTPASGNTVNYAATPFIAFIATLLVGFVGVLGVLHIAAIQATAINAFIALGALFIALNVTKTLYGVATAYYAAWVLGGVSAAISIFAVFVQFSLISALIIIAVLVATSLFYLYLVKLGKKQEAL